MMKTNISMSLRDILGKEYTDAAVNAAAIVGYGNKEDLSALADEQIAFYPAPFAARLDEMVDKIGTQIAPAFETNVHGAPTNSFAAAYHPESSPVFGFGWYRVGQDGRLYAVTKSEHYHVPMGHAFPGYRLIDNARALGISNATHNNTRGYITRLCERELVRCANGLKKNETEKLDAILKSTEKHVLNRVINLETGSLACEAGFKMMLSKFYKLDKTFPTPKYSGRIPVFFIMGDYDNGRLANYHGTTTFAQTLRDMWPELYGKYESAGAYKVVPVAINDIDDFRTKYEKYNQGEYKVAGFTHEIILMNYGGIRLTPEFLHEAYEICHAGDTPVMCDEIQSCMWYEGMFLFRKYGLNPDFVVVGKGFPGGQYPASKILLTAEMDTLNQFGALVTNGQEELASLSYLITMEFSEQNSAEITAVGNYYESKVRALKDKYSDIIRDIEGLELLSAIVFHDIDETSVFVKKLSAYGFDVSAQLYKAFCPPAALLKLPLIASKALIDSLIGKMELVFAEMTTAKK